MRLFGHVRVTDKNGHHMETHPVMGEYEEDAVRRSDEIYGEIVPRFTERGLLTCYIFMDWDTVICRK